MFARLIHRGSLLFQLGLAGLGAGAVACGGAAEHQSDRTAQDGDATGKDRAGGTRPGKSADGASAGTGSGDPGMTGSGSDAGSGAGADGAGDGKGDDGGTGNGGGAGSGASGGSGGAGSDDGGDDDSDSDSDDGSGGDDGVSGAAFFESRVRPAFELHCISCHADPRIPVDIRGPQSIYSYKQMLAYAGSAGFARENPLMNKIRNLNDHAGGDRCPDGFTQAPCAEVVEWWEIENGPDTGTAPSSLGRVTEISALGRIYGYAFDPARTMEAVTVTFYVDGERGVGTPMGSVVANRAGADGNTPGDHAFIHDIPIGLRDKQSHKLYVYVTVDGIEQPMTTDPLEFTAYAFSTEGREYYEANVRGRLNACAGCHTVTYEQQFYALIAPAPGQGGTATNNQLINKAAQINGVNHAGGLRCNNPNASPCAEFQAWWRAEFGSE